MEDGLRRACETVAMAAATRPQLGWVAGRSCRTGAYVRRDETPESIAVALEPWEAARPYIEAFDAAASDELFRIIAQEERDYGQLPAFYLDTAEWLYLHDLVPEASETLLSALDLPSSNDETVSIVADRLLRYGYFDRAI